MWDRTGLCRPVVQAPLCGLTSARLLGAASLLAKRADETWEKERYANRFACCGDVVGSRAHEDPYWHPAWKQMPHRGGSKHALPAQRAPATVKCVGCRVCYALGVVRAWAALMRSRSASRRAMSAFLRSRSAACALSERSASARASSTLLRRSCSLQGAPAPNHVPACLGSEELWVSRNAPSLATHLLYQFHCETLALELAVKPHLPIAHQSHECVLLATQELGC